jgi:hypothetical protein
MATRTQPRRYYAYSEALGRKRLIDSNTETEAIDAAKALGAANVVKEDGPPSKPHGVEMIWEDAPRDLTMTVMDAQGKVYLVARSALTPVED